MSRPVDVLFVLDRAAAFHQVEDPAAMREARAAVAELVEAATKLSAAIAWRAGVYASGDQAKMDFADQKFWAAKDAVDAALAKFGAQP